MSEHLIKPRKTIWERVKGTSAKWSPQVKQGLIAALVAVSIFLLSLLVRSTTGTSNVVKRSDIRATNVTGSAFVQGIGNTVVINNPPRSAHSTPTPPEIKIETLDGFPAGFTNNPNFRLHKLTVRNRGDAIIQSFNSRLQFPEAISETIRTNVSFDAHLVWRPLASEIIIKGTGGRTEGGLWLGPTSKVSFVEQERGFFPNFAKGQKYSTSRAGDITGVWELTIGTLPPHSHLSLSFVTSIGREGTNYMDLATVPLWSIQLESRRAADTNELRYSLEGEYCYPTHNEALRQHFLVPIRYDDNKRAATSLPLQPDNAGWNTVILDFE